jgi:hypothetical protein
MGEDKASEAAERVAYDEKQYDRVLRSLEKRTHRPKAASRVRDALGEALAAKPGPYPEHLSVLRVSQDSEGRPRVLTTNFDNMFEHAARHAGLKVPSHSLKSLPRPGGWDDFGIMHLHGRLADPNVSTEVTELVLTSADFGDAYLRDGWASRYMEDRMRTSRLVLLGYGADDAAMRLLLETLDAGRDRFPDLKEVYAIEKRTSDSASIWKAKGIRPIEFDSYDSIYATLGEWSKFALDPAGYRETRLKSIFGVP